MQCDSPLTLALQFLLEFAQGIVGATSPRHRLAQCHIYLNRNNGD